MMIADRQIGLANAGDIDGILDLQERNQPHRLFIKRTNAASLWAHARMGMREVAGFAHDGAAFAMLSYVG